MRLHLITVGQPKLPFAQAGWQEYVARLKHYHQVRLTHIADKHNDSEHLLAAAGPAYKVGLVIEGFQLSSPELAGFLEKRALSGQETAFLIGGPEGLPQAVIQACDYQWSLSVLTFPHDLAMVMTAEALYRASTISAGQPYHK